MLTFGICTNEKKSEMRGLALESIVQCFKGQSTHYSGKNLSNECFYWKNIINPRP